MTNQEIYDQVHAQEIKNSEFYIHNPSLAFLKGIYDDRVEAGTIDPISHTYRGPEELRVPVPKFDVRTADQIIVDANGKTTGYLDRAFQEYDINGQAVPKSKVANAVLISHEPQPYLEFVVPGLARRRLPGQELCRVTDASRIFD